MPIFASDLVSAAMPFQIPDARDAAEFLVEDPNVSPLAKKVANRLLMETGLDQLWLETPEDEIDPDTASPQIKRLRHLLVEDPRSPLKWVEIARLYAIRGQREQARRAMTTALNLEPGDRYVLRSAARLWLHLGDPEQAHRVIARARRTANDPWLIAAEIGLADIAGRQSRHLATGRSLVDLLPPLHVTELAASIGTAELEAGEDRRARRLFQTSLVDPNDNALAQAEWASKRVRLPDLQAKIESVPSSYEARALDARADGRVEDTIRYAHLWLADEPYSVSAAMFGSYEASKGGDFASGAQFAARGLVANPGDSSLINNVAFCMAKMNRVDEADEVLRRLPSSVLADKSDISLRATQGLVAFRRGDPVEGTRLYAEAIENAKDARSKAIAFVMFATELLRADPGSGSQVAAEASDQIRRNHDDEAMAWLSHLEQS